MRTSGVLGLSCYQLYNYLIQVVKCECHDFHMRMLRRLGTCCVLVLKVKWPKAVAGQQCSVSNGQPQHGGGKKNLKNLPTLYNAANPIVR